MSEKFIMPFGDIYNIIRQYNIYMSNNINEKKQIELLKSKEKSIEDVTDFDSAIDYHCISFKTSNNEKQVVDIPKSFVADSKATPIKLLTYILHKIETNLVDRQAKRLINSHIRMTRQELEQLGIMSSDDDFYDVAISLLDKTNLWFGYDKKKYASRSVLIRDYSIEDEAIMLDINDRLDWITYFPDIIIIEDDSLSIEDRLNKFINDYNILRYYLKEGLK